MRGELILRHEFVEYIPDKLEEATIYVSITFATVVHKCCCGCGNDVITPLSPTDWKLTFDGESISLDPSIGNWNFSCQSHYWIKRNRAKWSRQWTQAEVESGRRHDALAKKRYFDNEQNWTISTEAISVSNIEISKPKTNFWQMLKRRFYRL